MARPLTFKLEIEMENEAFVEDCAGELVRILHDAQEMVAKHDQSDHNSGPVWLYDSNGNRVGHWFIGR